MSLFMYMLAEPLQKRKKNTFYVNHKSEQGSVGISKREGRRQVDDDIISLSLMEHRC